MEEVGEFHFHKHRALATILAVAVANGEEMLMISLTNIRRQYKIILVLFIDVVDAEALAS